MPAWAWALVASAACAAPQPRSDGAPPAPGTCAFVRMEHSEAESDYDSDSVLITLVYRPPSGRAASADPVSTEVLVKRERVGDIQSHLQARPQLVCAPDRDAPGGYRVEPPR